VVVVGVWREKLKFNPKPNSYLPNSPFFMQHFGNPY
jgi:hypothetical protein